MIIEGLVVSKFPGGDEIDEFKRILRRLRKFKMFFSFYISDNSALFPCFTNLMLFIFPVFYLYDYW